MYTRPCFSPPQLIKKTGPEDEANVGISRVNAALNFALE